MPTPDADTDVLARTIWGEARGEGAEGMQAVANVIVNRSMASGMSIRDVCQRNNGKVWQFSAWNPLDPNMIRMIHVDASDPQFALALQIAAAATGGGLPDITGGALNYYNPRTASPSWGKSMRVTAQIGNHIFGVA